MMEIWVVVVERHDRGPVVVTFGDLEVANNWIRAYNAVSEIAWPSDFNNYAREPEKLVTPEVEMRRMLNEVRTIEEEL